MSKSFKVLIAGSVLAAAAAASAPALADVSANVALTSNYVWRGVSQSDSKPAIQGGFDYSHSSGFYAGVWGSNVDWSNPDSGSGNGASVEMDTYLGVSNTLSSGIGYDVGAIRYNYPGANPSASFNEVYVGGSYKIFSAKYSHSSSFAGPNDDSAHYLEAALNFSLPQDVSLGLHAGKSAGTYWKNNGGSYTDYKVDVSKDFGGFGFDLGYTTTSGGTKVKSGANQNDGQFMLTISKSM